MTLSVTVERAYPTPLANSTLLPLLLLSLTRQRHSPDGLDPFKSEYDFIVVGAGSAGSTVASRLSEMPCMSVLLLEAGHRPPLLTEVPGLGRYFWNTDVDWRYKTVPQKFAAYGYVDRQMPWATGKMMGGSSSLNSMIYVRGNMKNYDDWADMGAAGWSYTDVYPYFLKLEDNRDPEYMSNGYHSFAGPVTAERPRYESELKKPIFDAIGELGYPVLDSNGRRQTGFYNHQASIRDNQRCSTAKAYLVPAENRTNLDIVAGAMVTKVLIQDGEATGVQFDFRGKSFEVSARREVIVSAGTVNTAQLLKLSGIGSADELRKLNIPVVVDLPVGKNFQNHGGVRYPFVVNVSVPDFGEKLSESANIQEFIANRTGPLASNDGNLVTAFLRGAEISPSEDFPNYELYINEIPFSLVKGSGLTREVYDAFYGPYENRTLFACTVTQLQPKSVGTVTLQSNNPYDHPLIDPNYLADTRDVEDFLQGLKTCRRILATRAFQEIGATPLKTILPGCEGFAEDEDEYLRCFIRTLLVTYHHPVGTSKMGRASDPTTVLDPQLRVKNISRLRVVDASVMPLITSGNTNIPTIMIAEKISDNIKKTIDCFGNRSNLGDASSRRRSTDSNVEPESSREEAR